jgi:hypothetical protein
MRDLNAETLALLSRGLDDRWLVDPRPGRVRDSVTRVALDVDRCGGGFSDFLELMTRRNSYLGNQLAMAGSSRKRTSPVEFRETLESIWRTRHQPLPRAL